MQLADFLDPSQCRFGVAPVQHQVILKRGHAVLALGDLGGEVLGQASVAGEEAFVQPPRLVRGGVAEQELHVSAAGPDQGRQERVESLAIDPMQGGRADSEVERLAVPAELVQSPGGGPILAAATN